MPSDVSSVFSVDIHKKRLHTYTHTHKYVHIYRSRERDSHTERKIETHGDGVRKIYIVDKVKVAAMTTVKVWLLQYITTAWIYSMFKNHPG